MYRRVGEKTKKRSSELLRSDDPKKKGASISTGAVNLQKASLRCCFCLEKRKRERKTTANSSCLAQHQWRRLLIDPWHLTENPLNPPLGEGGGRL